MILHGSGKEREDESCLDVCPLAWFLGKHTQAAVKAELSFSGIRWGLSDSVF